MFLSAGGLGKNTLNNQIELIRSKPIMKLAWEIMKKYLIGILSCSQLLILLQV